MSSTTPVPGGIHRPGPPARDDGAVSIEAAFGIGGLVLVALCLAWCLALVGGELALASATRAAARVAARGEDVDAVVREAHRLVAALGPEGAERVGGSRLQNENGVIMVLRSRTKGLDLNLGNVTGLTVTME